MIANTSKPPYYAIIFTSLHTNVVEGYDAMSSSMIELAKDQPVFLRVESARNELGITVSHWGSLEDSRAWKHHLEHSVAREKGRSDWYTKFKVRICNVEKDYSFEK
jgi:heme-degrading monooxygenase HmoA